MAKGPTRRRRRSPGRLEEARREYEWETWAEKRHGGKWLRTQLVNRTVSQVHNPTKAGR